MGANLSEREQHNFWKSVDKYCVKRGSLLDKGRFSLAPEMGELAIVVSQATIDHPTLSPESQRRIFMDEAEFLKEEYERSGKFGGAAIYIANRSTMRFLLRSPEESSITAIGHGNANYIMLDQGDIFDWTDFADASLSRRGHLKQGPLTQRTCCHIPPSGLAVPLFTFSAKDQREIYGPIGEAIPDEHPNDELFERHMYEKSSNNVDDIRRVVERYHRNKTT